MTPAALGLARESEVKGSQEEERVPEQGPPGGLVGLKKIQALPPTPTRRFAVGREGFDTAGCMHAGRQGSLPHGSTLCPALLVFEGSPVATNTCRCNPCYGALQAPV